MSDSASSEVAPAVHRLRPALRPVDLAGQRAVHIIGIGGAGMRAIARVLLAMGHAVSGSDRTSSVFLDELAELGATVFVGHAAEHVHDVDMVTRSTAVPDDNPEVRQAAAQGTPVFSRAEVLASITALRPGILVAGTHGKTTTSSLLAVVLEHAGLAPSFIIGSTVAYFGSGARWGDTEHFVVEADESDGTFLTLPGAHAVVTSLDPDHLDFYDSVPNLQSAFEAFVDAVAGVTAVCLDDGDTGCLVGRPGVVTYGEHPNADVRIANVQVHRAGTTFTVHHNGTELGAAEIGLPGLHNALNAAAAITIALELGVAFAAIVEGLGQFTGVARRMEPRGSCGGVHFIDDYAHLPAEVEAAVGAATAGSWNRVVAAYQPHRYSRTEQLGATFAESFRGVDHLVLTDIYPSGEAPRPGVSGRIVFDAVVAACPEMQVSWQPTLDHVVDHLASVLGPGDLCLTLGAGDLTSVPDVIQERLTANGAMEVSWLVDLEPALTASAMHFNSSLGSRTTYRVGGAALAVIEVGSRHDLQRVVTEAAKRRVPVMTIGRGSNMLVADRGFQGIALALTGEFDDRDLDGNTVRLGASVSLPVAARFCVANGLTGFEWAVGVPGSAGGAVAMNAGGHGSDMAASVTQVTVMDAASGHISTRLHQDLSFEYRSSSIGPNDIVLDVVLELEPGDPDQGSAVLSEIVSWRREHQPGGQNAGSVFTNPEGDSAGRLIDAAGCKGLVVGTAHVSDKHANFFQAGAAGCADDVLTLMSVVAERVYEAFAIRLVPETRLVGFGAAALADFAQTQAAKIDQGASPDG